MPGLSLGIISSGTTLFSAMGFKQRFLWYLFGVILLIVHKGGALRKDISHTNLYPYGIEEKDKKLVDRDAQTGRKVDLFTFFPYYGAKYNYSIISLHGYITFGDLLEADLDFLMGDDVRHWPSQSDPATIAVYACRQKEISMLPSDHRGVYYRVIFRQDVARSITHGKLQDYVVVSNDTLLNQMEQDLKEGMVGAQNFKAAAALIVTWENVTFSQASRDDQLTKRATYQAVFMTDKSSQLSYVILNYHTLGYGGADISGQMKRGRCKAQFNGGNQTGVVLVDPRHSKYPTNLAIMSSVPHRVAGRYLFRVDDIVRRGGCVNMTSGTYRMTIYPDIVNAMGDVNIQLNGPCLHEKDQPVLEISESRPCTCKVKNSAIAECKMVRYYQWGSKNVYLKLGQNNAYVGSVYYVSPGLDPLQLDVGVTSKWFEKRPPKTHQIKWYPYNFTNEHGQLVNSLRLALWAYKERKNEGEKKFVPVLEKIAIVVPSVSNFVEQSSTDQATLTLNAGSHTSLQWVGNGERDFWSYRFGFLRLYAEDTTHVDEESGGLWSPPIGLNFWWGSDAEIERTAGNHCMDWFEEDGHQWNFIMDTETNSSCPCRLEQAQLDIARYMSHPKCSQQMRNLGCDAYVGAKDCYLSAQNVQGNYVTHYGQVCCYDRDGYLMQTSYQSLVQVENYFYSPGFPQRAYEFGTYPYTKQFEIPTLSNYYHDVMPYFFCCKWASDHCQFFYWRRPSSGCQNYQPPGIASVMGNGHFITFDNSNYTFNKPGTYVLLHKPETKLHYGRYYTIPQSPEVLIQIRLERYPNRMVDFSHGDLPQADLVQPLNVSVVTGLAIQEGSGKETDRVVVTLRKDVRRSRYRTNVLVNDELRYFDTVQRQKFRGVMVYVNSVAEGQSEVYVVLEKNRIGLRIRESYAVDIVQNLKYEESYGMLDVMVAIPPEYMVSPDASGSFHWDSAVAGLLGTFSESKQHGFLHPDRKQPQMSPTSANSATDNAAEAWSLETLDLPDLFTVTSQDHESWPEVALLKEVYPVAEKWARQRPIQEHSDLFNQKYKHCTDVADDPRCPDQSIMQDIERQCRHMHECKYDYFLTRQSILGEHIKREIHGYEMARLAGTKRYNSCGAMNIEYPEHLRIDPPTGKLYLEGDTVHFDCYQDHWVKGQTFFKCLEGGWTKGRQPWCRSKRVENAQKVLATTFGILMFIVLLFAVFVCCFYVKKQRQTKENVHRNIGQPSISQTIIEPTVKPSPRRVSISGADTLPLVKSLPEADLESTKDMDAKNPPQQRTNVSAQSTPAAIFKRSRAKMNTYTPPPTKNKRTWV